MRLYLSSFRNGNKPDELIKLLGDGRRTALINNAMDFVDADHRADSLANEVDRLKEIGLEPTEIDLRHYFGKTDELKEIIWDCLGILPYCVAPHYKSDHPESADIDKTVDYYIKNHIPFIALRDGEAIAINGNEQKVIQ